MELLESIEKRTSVRSFSSEKVKIEDIREMVRRGGLAPSVNNFQPWRFILVENRLILNELASMISEKYNQLKFKESKVSANIKKQAEWYSTFFTEAPALLVLVMSEYETILEKGVYLSHEEINKIRGYPDIQSAGACIQNILLSAVDLGYGACWLSGPLIAKDEIELRLSLGEKEKVICFVAIGIPAKDFEPKKKEDLGSKLEILK